MHDEFYSLTEKLKNILKSLNLKLAPVPYTTPKWPIKKAGLHATRFVTKIYLY